MSRTLKILSAVSTAFVILAMSNYYVDDDLLGANTVESTAEASPARVEIPMPATEISEAEKALLAKRREAHEASVAEAKQAKAERRQRKIRSYRFDSPAEARARLWNVPEDEHEEATATALLRVCISEADASQKALQDCVGIYQVIRNIRSRSCDRDRVRKITQCDESGETLLSVMRRASKSILGVVPPRSRRSTWISELGLSCEQPPSWPLSTLEWDRQYGHQKRCPRVARLVRGLVSSGKIPRSPEFAHLSWVPGRPVTWGGRCESGRGACDDDIACQRGLARLRTDTFNALWCVPGSAGCSDEIDEVCIKRGHPSLAERRAATEAERLQGG